MEELSFEVCDMVIKGKWGGYLSFVNDRLKIFVVKEDWGKRRPYIFYTFLLLG